MAEHASSDLGAAGVPCVRADSFTSEAARNSTCVVVCLDTPNPELMSAVNEAALREQWKWLPGQIESGVAMIGPAVVPHQSACYRCFALRREADLPAPHALPVNSIAAPTPLFACAGSLIALETVRMLSGIALPQTMGRVLKIDFFAPEMTWLRVLRLPNCPDCGYGKRRLPPISRAGR